MGAVYTQRSITERRRIERWRHAKVPVDEMARVLKRCRSAIFRELKRNHFSDECMPKCDGYYGGAAQLMAADRRARQRKLIKHPELCKRVIERIKNGWTPEQISNRMIYGGTFPRIVSLGGHVAPDGTESPNSIAMSAFCFVPMMSRTAASLVIGRLI